MPEKKWGTKSLQTGYRFDAIIESVEWKENNFGREQANIKLRTADGTERTLFIPYSERLDSKWGVFNKGLETSGVPVDLSTLDDVEKWLVGKAFTFEQYNKTISVLDRETDERISKTIQYTRPIKYLGESLPQQEQEQQPEQEKQQTKQQETKSQEVKEKSLDEKFLDAVKSGDISTDDLQSILGCDFSDIVELITKYSNSGAIVVLKGGILHYKQQ